MVPPPPVEANPSRNNYRLKMPLGHRSNIKVYHIKYLKKYDVITNNSPTVSPATNAQADERANEIEFILTINTTTMLARVQWENCEDYDTSLVDAKPIKKSTHYQKLLDPVTNGY